MVPDFSFSATILSKSCFLAIQWDPFLCRFLTCFKTWFLLIRCSPVYQHDLLFGFSRRLRDPRLFSFVTTCCKIYYILRFHKFLIASLGLSDSLVVYCCSFFLTCSMTWFLTILQYPIFCFILGLTFFRFRGHRSFHFLLFCSMTCFFRYFLVPDFLIDFLIDSSTWFFVIPQSMLCFPFLSRFMTTFVFESVVSTSFLFFQTLSMIWFFAILRSSISCSTLTFSRNYFLAIPCAPIF